VEMLEKVEIPPAATPVEFLPPIFVGTVFVMVFQCFCGALLPRCMGGLYICVFRSN
jgi:hypothetical protein